MRVIKSMLSVFVSLAIALALLPEVSFAGDFGAATMSSTSLSRLNAQAISTLSMDGEIVEIALGSAHSAAIASDGSLWMWGYNGNGQLGDGSIDNRVAPVKVMADVAQVNLGGSHSAAIKKDGTLWLWGNNNLGQLGDGTTEDRLRPVKIMNDVAQVALGTFQSAAIKNDGSLWMWGHNGDGRLGDGTTSDRHSPVKIMNGVSHASLGEYHSAAITRDGSLWTWGFNGAGQLGVNTPTSTALKYPAPTKIMSNVSQVSLGGIHSAAIRKDGSLWMWGYNGMGQLGNGGDNSSSSPVKVMDGVDQVSLGYYHSAALKTDGTLWTWGFNGYGCLGDGTTTNRNRPKEVLTGVSSVSLGSMFSGALKSDGSVWMWGYNAYGQVGDGSTEDRYSPAAILQDTGFDDDYSATAAKLLKNTNRLLNPLSEYNDPSRYTEKYRKSASGWIQTFISQYGKLKSDKEVWTTSYESALIDLLNNDKAVKEVARLGKYDKWLQKGFSAVAGEIESAAKVKKVLSQEGKLLSIMLSALTDTQKLSIKQDYAKIELLEGVRNNTSDTLLKKACANCMGAYYSNTINTVKGIALDALPKVLIKKAAAADLATAPVISKALSVGGGLAATSAVLTGAAEALGYVGVILLAKDVASWLTGMDARTDAYLKTACLEEIYQSGRRAYNGIVGNTPSSYHVSWFNFVLQTKQKQYASMAKIYRSGTWSKELKSDGFLANRCKLIKSITVNNYSKAVTASTVQIVGTTYTGRVVKPAVTVKMGDSKLVSGKDYTVTYSNNINAGLGLVVVKAKGDYKGTMNVKFQIKQANNTAKATKTSVNSTIKASSLAKKSMAVGLPVVKSSFGKARWSVTNKDKKKVLSLSGSKVKVKQGAKKGTYTIKLRASVAKTANYKGATTKTVTIKVKVK